MTFQQKEKDALALIGAQMDSARSPIVLCSFGKDSVVLLHLCLRFRKVPVLFFRFSRFHEKSAHALRVAQEWDLEVFDMWPTTIDEYQREEFFEIFHGYRTGPNHFIYLASGIRKRREDETRYLCAIDDLTGRPRSYDHTYQWDVTFHGQKGCDDIELGSSSQITQPVSDLGRTRLVVPFANWTDADIWEYIRTYDLPYDRARYDLANESTSPDKFPTCYKCIDQTEGESVYCPKQQVTIGNFSRPPEEHERFRQALIGNLHYCEVTGDARTSENTAHL